MEFASLEDLWTQLDLSVSTVRPDLTMLEGGGKLRRTHGGARLAIPESDEFAFASRDVHQFNEKESIGRAVAKLIGRPLARSRARASPTGVMPRWLGGFEARTSSARAAF